MGITLVGYEMEEKIRNWLSTQGYPLEMRVAKEFRDRNFSVLQSDYYKDPETGIQREIDVTAVLQDDTHGVLVQSQLCG